MAGWSKLTQVELRALLRSHVQPVDGNKTALVQRLTAFLSDDSEATCDDDVGEGGPSPSASETAELEAAGASTELSAWRAATSHLDDLTTSLAQQRAQARAEARAAQLAEGQAKAACARQRATVKAAAAAARAVLHQHRVRHNEQTCQLLQLVGQDDLRPTFMRAEVWGVVGLWRLRGVCRAFRRWAQAKLLSLPRLVAVGGMTFDRSLTPPKWVATASVESLDLSTMRWSAAGCMPSLPDPRAWNGVSSCADGRVVVCCGYNHRGADRMVHLRSTALQWLPGTGAWSALPDLPAGRDSASSVRLPDGRTMLIGGRGDNDQALASVLVLAADGSGWSDLPSLTGARASTAAALLPDGKVLVAGGKTGRSDGTALNTAELWDPATQKWTALPPMAHKRTAAAACVLLSGRVAVMGGSGTDSKVRKDGEVFDPAKREWEPLRAEMAQKHGNISTVAVAGGLIVVGGEAAPELYEEESGRWFTLPHAMVQQRKATGLVPVAAAALGLVPVAAAALEAAATTR
jgi:N-acetylneuraminic acid mutarotase